MKYIIPKINNPPETFYVCCYRDKEGTLHPNYATAHPLTNGCATRVKDVLGLSTYQRKQRGFVIMPFKLRFEPDWVAVEEELPAA